MARSLEDQVRAYQDLVLSLAERRGRKHPNEVDDMNQEGLIFVWRALEAGKTPTEEQIDNRMRNWLKYRSRQLRETPTDLNKLLPMEAHV
jgi:DNA-directed RNA polymerase specialized sigma24 family protein